VPHRPLCEPWAGFIVLGAMPVPPNWFYHAAEPRIAGYVGPDAAALWVSSRFWFLVAWVLAAPVGLSCLLLAETPRAPSALWVAAGACWIGALPFGTRSLVKAGAATRSASAFLSETVATAWRFHCRSLRWPPSGSVR